MAIYILPELILALIKSLNVVGAITAATSPGTERAEGA